MRTKSGALAADDIAIGYAEASPEFSRSEAITSGIHKWESEPGSRNPFGMTPSTVTGASRNSIATG